MATATHPPTLNFHAPYFGMKVVVAHGHGVNETPCNYTWTSVASTFYASNGTFEGAGGAFAGPCRGSPNGTGQMLSTGAGFQLFTPGIRINGTGAHSIEARFAASYGASLDVVVPSGNYTTAWALLEIEDGVSLHDLTTNKTVYGLTDQLVQVFGGYGNSSTHLPTGFAKGSSYLNATLVNGHVYVIQVFFEAFVTVTSGLGFGAAGVVTATYDFASGGHHATLLGVLVS